MSNDIGVARKRLEEYKKEFSGEGMDRDVIMFRERAAIIKREKELEATPEPPSAEDIIKELHRNKGNPGKRRDD